MSALAERVRTCEAPDCNEEIPAAAHGLQRFCGLDCRHRTQRERQRERRQNPERPNFPPMPCAAPGCTTLVANPAHRLFCSRDCRLAAGRIQKEAARRARGVEPRAFTEPRIQTTSGPPFAVVRERLERFRSAGRTFAEAWPRATAWGECGREIAERTAALEETRDAWRRAYENEPARPAEVAAVRLTGMGDLANL